MEAKKKVHPSSVHSNNSGVKKPFLTIQARSFFNKQGDKAESGAYPRKYSIESKEQHAKWKSQNRVSVFHEKMAEIGIEPNEKGQVFLGINRKQPLGKGKHLWELGCPMAYQVEGSEEVHLLQPIRQTVLLPGEDQPMTEPQSILVDFEDEIYVRDKIDKKLSEIKQELDSKGILYTNESFLIEVSGVTWHSIKDKDPSFEKQLVYLENTTLQGVALNVKPLVYDPGMKVDRTGKYYSVKIDFKITILSNQETYVYD